VAAEKDTQLRVRAAAGEGYGMATAVKYKMCKMNQEARRLTAAMQALDNGPGTDIRANWSINQGARRLMFNSLMTLREVQTTRLQLAAVSSINTNAPRSTTVDRKEAPEVAPATSPGYSIDIGSIANAANKLASLLSAKQVITSFVDGINGSRATQNEYAQIKAAAVASQQRVEALAASEARKKGISAATLLSIANSYMQNYDRTTWDDANKANAAKAAANAAENALDGRVSGDVSDNWDVILQQRAEAFKQEAYFRSIAQDAADMEKSTITALAEYEQSLGVKVSDTAALNAAIQAAQNEVGQLSQKLASAPADVVSKRDQILTSSGIAAAMVPEPSAE
jgi:hypothetical protein